MKHRHHQYHHDQNQHPVNVAPLPDAADPRQNGVEFGPSQDDVAKRAYSIYENQGSRPGYDVQHWQEAEAQLVEERNCALDRGLPKLSKN
jgi:hypothetical protein